MSRRVDFVGKGPIIFEGRELPELAKGFELVPFWEKLPPDTRDWLMDLHYCWGRTRRHGSRRILRHVKLVRQKLNEEHANATERLRLRFPEATEAELGEMVADWHKSLDLIEAYAQRTKTCEWTIVAQDESLEGNLKLAIKWYRDGVFGAPPLVRDLAPGFEFRIRSLPREEQLEWLASFTDSLTKKETSWQRLWKQTRRLFCRRTASDSGDSPQESRA